MERRKRHLRTTLLSAGLATLLVVGGGTAWAVDRFLIPHVEIADVADVTLTDALVVEAAPARRARSARARARAQVTTPEQAGLSEIGLFWCVRLPSCGCRGSANELRRWS